MALASVDEGVFLSVTWRRAQLLSYFADGRSEPFAAEAMGISVSGVRSQVEDLKDLTDCASVGDLGRWWREHRQEWLSCLGRIAGDDVHTGP